MLFAQVKGSVGQSLREVSGRRLSITAMSAPR